MNPFDEKTYKFAKQPTELRLAQLREKQIEKELLSEIQKNYDESAYSVNKAKFDDEFSEEQQSPNTSFSSQNSVRRETQ